MPFPVACYPKADTTLQSTGFVGVLDNYTAGITVCWDIKRRLLSTYNGKACIVRANRIGQPTYEIEYMANGEWDLAGLQSFAGTDTTYLVSPYSQLTGLPVFAQSNAVNQPIISDAGVVHTDGALFGTRVDETYLTAGNLNALDVFGSQQAQIYFRVNSGSNAANVGRLFSHNSLLCYIPFQVLGNVYFDFPDRINTATPAGLTDHLRDISLEREPSVSRIRMDGTTQVSGSVSTSIASASGDLYVGRGLVGNISSCVIWNTCDATTAAARNAALA